MYICRFTCRSLDIIHFNFKADIKYDILCLYFYIEGVLNFVLIVFVAAKFSLHFLFRLMSVQYHFPETLLEFEYSAFLWTRVLY